MDTTQPIGRSSLDDVIDYLKANYDKSLLVENLKLTPTQRILRLQGLQAFASEVRRGGKKLPLE